jgi:hypothetical protein
LIPSTSSTSSSNTTSSLASVTLPVSSGRRLHPPGLSTGARVGIGIGVALGALLIIGAMFLAIKKRKVLPPELDGQRKEVNQNVEVFQNPSEMESKDVVTQSARAQIHEMPSGEEMGRAP